MSILVFEKGVLQAESTSAFNLELLDQQTSNEQKPSYLGAKQQHRPLKNPNSEKDSLQNRRQMQAREIMTSPVITAVSHDLVSQVTKSLLEADISHVVAVDLKQHPIGIINISTLMSTPSPETQFIQHLFGPSVMAVDENTMIRDIAAIFINYKATAICVVNQQHQLSGIICRVDLLNLLVSSPKH